MPLVHAAAGHPLWARPVGEGARARQYAAATPQQEQDLHAFIEPLSPLPDQVLTHNSPHAYLAARIAANAAIVRIALRLDGVVLHPEIVGRDDVDATIFYQPRYWRTGRHNRPGACVGCRGSDHHASLDLPYDHVRMREDRHAERCASTPTCLIRSVN